MPKHDTETCPAGVPTLLTDEAVTAARVQGGQGFWLCATLDTTPPENVKGGLFLLPWMGISQRDPLAEIFGGVGATVYLWAWPESTTVDVSISYS